MMDCSICSGNALPFFLRPPRNTICAACYEEAKIIIAFASKPEIEEIRLEKSSNFIAPLSSSNKGFANTVKLIKEMRQSEEELNERVKFLSGFVGAYTDQIHCDIQINPGHHGPSIYAHKSLLVSRSEIFKNILDDTDECKASNTNAITFSELSHEELDTFLEFLYSGTLAPEKLEKHVYSLTLAADKYDIPYLQKLCKQKMLGTLNSSNALDVLEVSDVCSNQRLKEAALNFIVKNMEDIVFSDRFDDFALKNPHLSVQITRASFMNINNRKNV